MDATAYDTIRDVTRDSEEGRVTFPTVLARLAAAGIERYHADLCRGEKTYYASDGTSRVEPSRPSAAAAADRFVPDAVEAAVRASQRGEIAYAEFCTRVLAAGCVGYIVSLPGRRVVYYGRTAETHVERFPPAQR